MLWKIPTENLHGFIFILQMLRKNAKKKKNHE